MKVYFADVKNENEQFSKLKRVKVIIFSGVQSKSGLQGDVKVGEASMKSESDNRKIENANKKSESFLCKGLK